MAIWSSPREGAMMVQAFDPRRLETVGDPVRVPGMDGVYLFEGVMAARFSLSERHDRLSSRAIGAGIARFHHQRRQGIRLDRSGLGRSRASENVSHGRSLALIVARELWRYNLDGRPPVKLTSDGALSPVWSRDGRRIVYEGGGTLRAVPADGSGKPEDVAPKGHFHPHSFTADSREIVAVQLMEGARSQLTRQPCATAAAVPRPIAQGGFPLRSRLMAVGWPIRPRRPARRRFGFDPIQVPVRRFACLPMVGRNQCGQRTDASSTIFRTTS